MNAQETANAIGAKLREAEANAAAENAADTAGSLADLHELLAQAYSDFHSDLDWNAIAGISATSVKGAHTDGGTGKTPPRASN